MIQILKKAKLISIFILAIAFLGCDEDDTVLPKVISDFSFTLNEDTGTLTFINTSEEASKYEWDFGDGETSTEINPIKTYSASGTYNISLEAFNVAGASTTFEDEVIIVIKEKIALPITFDNNAVDYDATVFGGASFEIVNNPDVSGSNDTASNVGAITNGGNAFEGFFFDIATPIDLMENKTIQMNFWSEVAVDLLLKLEEGTGADSEMTASHGGTGWEMISFNFSSDASYSRFTFFVDGPGTIAGTFYIDGIEQVETVVVVADSGCTDTPVAATALPLDFEGCATFPSADNFGSGITSELAANPSKTGINTSDFVLQVDKPTGSDFFAGIQNTFENNFDLTTTDTFKVKVYATKANAIFRFELAVNPQTEPVTGNPAPVFVTIPNANEWTEVEVIFTGLPGGPTAYNQLVIKPDNDMADSPITDGGTYYFDDLTLGTAGGGNMGGDFDSGLLTNGDFENGGDSWIGNALNVMTEGGNSFNLADVQAAGNPFDVNLSQVVEITQGSNYILSFDASSDRARTILAGIGLNVDPFTNTTQSVNLTTDTQTFTLSLSAADFGGVDSRVIFDMGADVGTVVIDNVSLVLDETGGGDMGQGEIAEACAGSLLRDYEAADNSIFSDFGGATAVVIDNPNTTVNMSAKVGQMQKFAGEPFGGTTMSLDAPADFSNGEIFTMDVFSQRASDLTFKLEGLNIEKVITTAGTGWETMIFDFTGETGAAAVSAITLIFDNGTVGDAAGDPDAWTFLFDNLRLCDGGGGDMGQGTIDEACAGSLLRDYEAADNSIFSDFGGATAVVIDNPNTTVNMSAKVGQMQKFAGEPFGGTTMTLDAPADFSNGEIFTMDVFSQRASDLTFKLEGLNIEKVITTAGTGWETMTFDFTGETGAVAVSAITLIFDNGTVGDAAGDPDAWTFLFDNLRLCDSGSGGGDMGQGTIDEACVGGLLQDYEAADNSIFSDFGGAIAVVIDNPNTTVNMSAKVGQMQKFAGELFGGTTMTLNAPADFSNGEIFTMDVFSQRASALTFKLEGLNIERVITTVGTGWETMTFDFTGMTSGAAVPSITLIFDNGTVGDAAEDPDAWTFLFDNLRLCDSGSGGGDCPAPPAGDLVSNGDFETGTDSCWELFQNGGTATVDNTMSNGGGSSSGRLVINAPGNPAFKQNFIGVGTVNAGDVIQIQFDHIGSIVPPGAVFNVLLFGEQAGDGASFTHVFNPAPVLSGTWTTFTGTFTIPAVDVSGGLSFLIEAVCGGDAGCSVTANIDNVSVTLNP